MAIKKTTEVKDIDQVTLRVRSLTIPIVGETSLIVSEFGRKSLEQIKAIDTAMSEDYSRADLLNQAKEDARKFITKYNTLEQLNKVKEEMLLFIND